MPKLLASLLGAVSVAAVFVGTSLADHDPANPSHTVMTGEGTVTPNVAGTPKKPQGVKIKVNAHFKTPDEFEKPIITGGVGYFPKGSLYNGGKYPKCDQNTLARKGLRGCPPHSIMGKGTGKAWADDVITRPQITVVNGGKNRVYLYTVLNNPARVQAPVPGIIKKTKGKWAYELKLSVPEVLQVVAGVPIQLEDLTITAGGKSYAKDWLATTYCPPSKKWEVQGTAFLDNGGSTTFTNSTPCKPSKG